MSNVLVAVGLNELPTDTDALQQAIARSFEAGARRPDGKPGKARPHQVAAVTKLVTAVRQDCHAPAPTSYLLQHAAGSGKSLTIAALVSALLRAVDDAGRQFHTVLVVTDRLQLDQQLGDTLTDFIAGNGYPSSTVARASSSSQLRSHLLTPPGTPGRPAVILTTIQKLASLWRNAATAAGGAENQQQQDEETSDLGGTTRLTLAASRAAAAGGGASELASVLGQGRVAIIADEAHRHHGSHTSEQISDILAAVFGGQQQQQHLVIRKKAVSKQKAAAAAAAVEVATATDGVLMQKQQRQEQPRFVTYFGFTATPGPRALQLFGVAEQVQVDILGNVVTATTPEPLPAAAAAVAGGVNATQQQQQQQQQQQRQDPVAAAAAAEMHLSPAILFTPFHCYSLQHATADGLVLDVLQRFVAVTPRFQISGLQLTQQQRLQLQQLDAASRAAAEVAGSNHGGSASKKVGLRDELGLVRGNLNSHAAVGSSSSSSNGVGSLAEGLLIHAASNSRQLVMTKAQDIVQRFMDAWSEAVACGFMDFRAMVVVRSRQHVVWYCQELRNLLQQYCEQIQQLMAALGGPADMAAARAAAAGDMSALCYGAFSGTVGVAAAEAERLFNPAAAAAASTAAAATTLGQSNRKRCSGAVAKGEAGGTAADDDDRRQQQQQQRQRRVNSTSSSGWDAALAAFDAEQIAIQQQQQEQQQQQDTEQHAAAAVQPRSTVKRRRGGTSSTITAGSTVTDSSCNPSSSSSSSSGESDFSMLSDDISSDDSSGNEDLSSSDSDTAAAVAASTGGDSAGLGDSWTNATAPEATLDMPLGVRLAAAADGGDGGALQQEQQQQRVSSLDTSAGDLAFRAKKRPRRDAVSDVAAAAAANTSVQGCSRSEQQQQQQHEQSSDTDSVPLLQRRQLREQRRQQQQQQPPSEVAGAELLVPVSERDLNSSAAVAGLSHADARLLVVCSKFETGYDDPCLGAIFVDRPLSGARAVQVLGRVNRPAPGKGSSINTNTAAAAAAGDTSASTAAAAAASKAAPPPGFRVLVVDFVNSVGGIREAFSQFYGATSYCTGSQAKRLRQQQTLDESLSRMLEVLQPAAARQAAAAALAQQLHVQGTSTRSPATATAAAAGGGSSSSAFSGSLADMNVGQVCGLVAGLQPEVQHAFEDDLAQYCSSCMKLRLEKLEFPYVFAAAVQAQLATLRQRRDKAASSGKFAWMDKLTAAAAAVNPDGTCRDAGVANAADGSAASDASVPQQQQQQRGETATAAAAAPVSAAAQLSHELKSSKVAVDVVQLEETFAGRVRLNPADALKPLHSVKLSSHLSAGSNSHNKKNNNQVISAESQVKAGRPLHEVIAAANAQLARSFKKQVAAGLRELCDKLRDGSSSDATAATAAGRQPVASNAAAAAAGGIDAELTATHQQQQQAATGASVAPPPAAAAAEQPGGEEGDVYTVMSLLRRLQLWPVSAQLLQATQAGKQVSGLAKTHPHPMVRSLAAQVVAEWKATLARQAMVAAAAKEREQQQQQEGGAGSEKGKVTDAVAASGIDEGLRFKVVIMMRDALIEHRAKVQQQQGDAQQQQQQQLGFDKSNVPASEAQRLQTLAEDLERELHTHMMQLHSRSSSSISARAMGGLKSGSSSSSSSGTAMQDYKKQARMVCTGLRYPDGVAVQLLAGERAASEVVRLDALALAPAAVQAAVAKRREEQRRSEAVWEELVSQSIGGGGTYVTTDVKCPQCGEKRAQVHTILSGGTYAQERQTIQKYVCKQCTFTWRSDS